MKRLEVADEHKQSTDRLERLLSPSIENPGSIESKLPLKSLSKMGSAMVREKKKVQSSEQNRERRASFEEIDWNFRNSVVSEVAIETRKKSENQDKSEGCSYRFVKRREVTAGITVSKLPWRVLKCKARSIKLLRTIY